MLVLALQFSRGDVTHAELCLEWSGRARRSGVGERWIPTPSKRKRRRWLPAVVVEGGTESLSTSRSDG
jgi:hypothetical protein